MFIYFIQVYAITTLYMSHPQFGRIVLAALSGCKPDLQFQDDRRSGLQPDILPVWRRPIRTNCLARIEQHLRAAK